MIIASSQGGVNIEDIAATNPDAIIYTPVDVNKGIDFETARKIACQLKVDDLDIVTCMIIDLYKVFVEKDALLLEINPLVLDCCGNCKFFLWHLKSHVLCSI